MGQHGDDLDERMCASSVRTSEWGLKGFEALGGWASLALQTCPLAPAVGVGMPAAAPTVTTFWTRLGDDCRVLRETARQGAASREG